MLNRECVSWPPPHVSGARLSPNKTELPPSRKKSANYDSLWFALQYLELNTKSHWRLFLWNVFKDDRAEKVTLTTLNQSSLWSKGLRIFGSEHRPQLKLQFSKRINYLKNDNKPEIESTVKFFLSRNFHFLPKIFDFKVHCNRFLWC